MYSIVLVMTLGSGGDAVAWQEDHSRPALHANHQHQVDRHRRGGCWGGGCYGGGCWGGGCWGGGCWGGGCWGGGYGGCWGGGYSYGCCGGGGGTPYAAPPSSMPPPRRRSYYNGEYETPLPGAEGARDQRGLERDRIPSDRRDQNPPEQRTPGGDIERRTPGKTDREQPNKPPEQSRSAAPATIIVSLPADAMLTVDDTPTRSVTARRVFVSPPLAPGKAFHYTFKAEAMRDGQNVSTTKRVEVRAGQETRVELTLPPERVARR
jgi:uncharacterized protein (TIGR03000 family)